MNTLLAFLVTLMTLQSRLPLVSGLEATADSIFADNSMEREGKFKSCVNCQLHSTAVGPGTEDEKKSQLVIMQVYTILIFTEISL